MKVKDKEIKQMVDVCEEACVSDGRECYWPRPDPGVFSQGRGYKKSVSGDRGWLCGTREIHGCPDEIEYTEAKS